MLSKREKVFMAVLGSLLLHGLILLLLGLSLRAKATPIAAAPQEGIRIEIKPPEEEPPPEIPSNLAPTPPPPFVENRNTNASPPPDHAFESNNDSVAATELPATGLAPVPTQEGKKIPEFNFATTSYTAGDHPAESASSSAQSKSPAQPPPPEQTRPPDLQPTPTPPPPKPAATPAPEPTPEHPVERDEFAMLGPTPTPHPLSKADEDPFDPSLRQPRTEPPRPTPVPRRAPPVQPPSNLASSGYQAMTQKAAMSGAITNRGPVASVAALGTPMGRYKKALTDAIGSRWYYYMGQREDVASFGTVKIHFIVDSTGKVRRPQVVSNTGNSTLENVSIQAIVDANIPPIPPEVSALINSNQMELDFSFALVEF